MESVEERLRRVEAALMHFIENTTVGGKDNIIAEMQMLINGDVSRRGIMTMRNHQRDAAREISELKAEVRRALDNGLPHSRAE